MDQQEEIDFGDPDLEIPVCIFCEQPFSIRFERTPYILPCGEHFSCKQCLKLAKEQKLKGLTCPQDQTLIDINNLKALLKNTDILDFIAKLEEYQDKVAAGEIEERPMGIIESLAKPKAEIDIAQRDQEELEKLYEKRDIEQDEKDFLEGIDKNLEVHKEFESSPQSQDRKKFLPKKKKKKKQKGTARAEQIDPMMGHLSPMMIAMNPAAAAATSKYNVSELEALQDGPQPGQLPLMQLKPAATIATQAMAHPPSQLPESAFEKQSPIGVAIHKSADMKKLISVDLPERSNRSAIKASGRSQAQQEEARAKEEEENELLTMPDHTVKNVMQPSPEAQQQEKKEMEAAAVDLLVGGGSDDDSVLYCDRNFGRGVPNDVHTESQWDIDMMTGERKVRPRRCKEHPKENARYLCKDHGDGGLVLCPKCLVKHKLCNFAAMGAELTFETRQKFRAVLTKINVRYNVTGATIRKVQSTIDGLNMYLEKQVDDINFHFDEIIKVLDARRKHLINEVQSLVDKLKLELRVDEEMAQKKREMEGEVLQKVRDLQAFVFAVDAKEHKRAMVKYNQLVRLDREFDLVDAQWQHHQFYVYSQFRFPDDQFRVNLDAMRNFARGVGHFIEAKKLAQILETESKPKEVVVTKKTPTLLKRIIWFEWGTYNTYKFDARQHQWAKYDTDKSHDLIPPFKHLYFSSVAHLPEGKGCYLIGGADEYNNIYRRVLFFEKYEKFQIVNSMIRNRAFHCSAYLKKRNEVFTFGGNQGGNQLTTNAVEVFDPVSNTWRDKQPMLMAREGASVCVFEIPQQVFIFGGMNMESGRLDTIEQYDINLDTWKLLEVKILQPLANFVVHSLGREKVLILGNNKVQEEIPETEQLVTKNYQVLQVLDLSAPINKEYSPASIIEEVFMPSFLDQNGMLYMFQGCADNQPKILKQDISKLIKLYLGT